MGLANKSIVYFENQHENENVLQLNGSSWARKLDFGTAWNTLRVGVLCQFGPDYTENFSGYQFKGNVRFAVGLSKGTGNPLVGAGVDHWVGALTNDTLWTASDTAAAPYWQCDNIVPAKYVGTTLTTGTDIVSSGACMFEALDSGAFPRRNCYMVDIIKGSPNFTIRLFCLTTHTSGASADPSTEAAFRTRMEEANPSQTNYTWFTGQTLAVDEVANGTLDSINIAWERPGPPYMLLSIIGLARLS